MYDERLIEPQRTRLRATRDVGAVETMTFDGLGTTMIEHETVSDPGRAYMDFNVLSEGTVDSPLFQSEGQPVPVFHASFKYDIRKIRAARRAGRNPETRSVDWASRRVLELVEQNVIGTAPAVPYGSSSHADAYSRTPGVYGMLTFPDRLSKTDLTIPTGSNPEATVQDVLEMRQLLYDANHYGPYGIYHSTDWDVFLDNDYARLGGNNSSTTLRKRLLEIGTEGGTDTEGERNQIKFVKRLDSLTPTNSHAFTMIMVSLNPGVMRLLNGMPLTVFQHEMKYGWEIHYRVACIMLAEFFADFNGNCGVLQARTA